MTKTQCIGQLAHWCGGIRYSDAGIGVWYTKLAVVVGGRMRVWFWRVATGRSFCLPTMMGWHIRYQVVAYLVAFGGGL